MSEKVFINQVAIVTGGNSGIGKAVCLDLARKGAKVMIIGRNQQKNEEVKRLIEEENGYAEAYSVDVSDKESVYASVDKIFKKHGKVEILVCNAGSTTAPSLASKMPEEDWDGLLKTHLYGTFYFVKACGERMKANKYGRIVLMSSLAGVWGLAANVSYGVAKTGLLGMTYTLAKEFGPYGITVNAIQPGVIETPLTEEFVKIIREEILENAPIKKIGQPEDVAHAVNFFCLPQSEFLTGVTMKVDGGYILNCGMDRMMMSFADQGVEYH